MLLEHLQTATNRMLQPAARFWTRRGVEYGTHIESIMSSVSYASTTAVKLFLKPNKKEEDTVLHAYTQEQLLQYADRDTNELNYEEALALKIAQTTGSIPRYIPPELYRNLKKLTRLMILMSSSTFFDVTADPGFSGIEWNLGISEEVQQLVLVINAGRILRLVLDVSVHTIMWNDINGSVSYFAWDGIDLRPLRETLRQLEHFSAVQVLKRKLQVKNTHISSKKKDIYRQSGGEGQSSTSKEFNRIYNV